MSGRNLINLKLVLSILERFHGMEERKYTRDKKRSNIIGAKWFVNPLSIGCLPDFFNQPVHINFFYYELFCTRYLWLTRVYVSRYWSSEVSSTQVLFSLLNSTLSYFNIPPDLKVVFVHWCISCFIIQLDCPVFCFVRLVQGLCLIHTTYVYIEIHILLSSGMKFGLWVWIELYSFFW